MNSRTCSNLQFWPKSNVLSDFDHTADGRVVAESLHVENKNRGHALKKHLLVRVQYAVCSCGVGNLDGLGVRDVRQCVFDGKNLVALQEHE